MDKNNIKQKIIELENNINQLKSTIARTEKNLIALKELIWEREAKKESSKMYKVLENEKSSTIVRSNVGDVVVDREFMEKEIQKHLDNPALRGMVTTEEMLSYPKVARNVEAEYNVEHKDYTWKIKANDENVLLYGSREYKKDNKDINRLLTAHSRTESNQRVEYSENGRTRSAPPPLFNDPNFRTSANDTIIPQNNNTNTNQQKPHIPIQAELQRKLTINLNNFERVSNKEQKQSFLARANEISKQAQNLHIELDSKSMQRLERCNLTQNKLNTKER